MKVGNVLRLFDVAQHVHLLFVRHSVPNLHLSSSLCSFQQHFYDVSSLDLLLLEEF